MVVLFVQTGQLWIQVHPPNASTKLRLISVGDANHVWALDTSDRLYMRQETSSPAFPEVKLLPHCYHGAILWWLSDKNISFGIQMFSV